MSIMSDIIMRIEVGQMSRISDIIKDLISDHRIQHNRMIKNYERYKSTMEGVPIFMHTHIDKSKINNQLNNAFDRDIIDTKVGYMLGNPIIYDIDTAVYTSTEINPDTGEETEIFNQDAYDLDIQVIKDFNKTNHIELLDSETLKMATICAYGIRQLYIGEEGTTRVQSIEPWECIVVRDSSLDEPKFAMRYYEIMDGKETKTYVEWYDETNVYYFISSTQTDKDTKQKEILYVPFMRNGKESQPHMFKGVPIIKFDNNKEEQGDCEKVYSLIDGYDITLSDINSELEQFRLAYMAFYGMVPDEDVMERARRTGAFGFGDTTSRAEFLTKDLSDTVIENHLNRLEDNIYGFAQSVNFSDEAFGGTVTGIAMKFKMFSLESKCVTSEREFTSSLMRMYKLLSFVWNVKGSNIDYKNIEYTWTRNFPLNLLDEAQTTVAFAGLISDKTRLGLLSFVDDVGKELAQMEKEQGDTIDLDIEELEVDEFGNPIEEEEE